MVVTFSIANILIMVIVKPNSGCVFDVAGICICMKVVQRRRRPIVFFIETKTNSGARNNIDRKLPRQMLVMIDVGDDDVGGDDDGHNDDVIILLWMKYCRS